jgi:hypothetical protein
MIIAQQKDLTEIQDMIASYGKILLVGCGTCMTFCSAGGPSEVDGLAEALVSEKKDLSVEKSNIPRQCSMKFIDRLEGKVGDCEAILSMACGNGVQAVASGGSQSVSRKTCVACLEYPVHRDQGRTGHLG